MAKRYPSEKVVSIVEKAKDYVELELLNVERFSRLADETLISEAKLLFRELASEGQKHAGILKGIVDRLFAEWGVKEEKQARKPSSRKLPAMPKFNTDVEKIYHALRDFINLEKDSRAEYDELAKLIELTGEIKDKAIKDQLLAVARDEMEHRDKLEKLKAKLEGEYRDLLCR